MINKNISFVIPAYNSQDTIGLTLDSIFDGNFSSGDEIIVVNDCSSDGTVLVVEEKSKEKNVDIKIITNSSNKGCPASRNVGISQAKNELIMSFDSDNLLIKGTVEKLKHGLILNNSDIASVGEVHFFADNPKLITHRWIFKPGFFGLQDLFAGNINPGPVGNYMFTKESWVKVGGFAELKKGLHEAWIFTLKQLSTGSKLFIVSDTKYIHRYGHESLTIREYKDNVESGILSYVIDNFMQFFNSEEKAILKSNNPNWIHDLNKKPITVEGKIGKNGKLQRTLYGVVKSFVKIWKKKK